MSHMLFQPLEEKLAAIEGRLAYHDAQLTRLAHGHPVCQCLMTIPGLGELTATALVAAVSDAAPCNNGRPFSAWLGLVPWQRDRRSQWARSLLERRGWNRAAVALANQNARVA